MRHVTVLLSCLAAIVWCFVPTSVYLQAIDKIIQKLSDSLELKDFEVLCENVECYNEHAAEFLHKLKAKEPSFRSIAIEHCRVGEPQFPNHINIHAYQLNLGWNDTQAAHMFKLVNESRHLWMTFEEICKKAEFAKYLDKFSPDFK